MRGLADRRAAARAASRAHQCPSSHYQAIVRNDAYPSPRGSSARLACRGHGLPGGRQAGRNHRAADAKAVAAFRKALPDMRERETAQEVIQAIAYAAANHTEWFWRGVHGDQQ